MKLADPLPIKFPRQIKKWLMQQARKREDKSVSGVVRDIVKHEAEKRNGSHPAR